MKIGTTVKVKSAEMLRKLTNIGFKKSVTLKNGLIFHSSMLGYAGQLGVITKIVKPGDDNGLTSDSYKIGQADVYWNEELLVDLK